MNESLIANIKFEIQLIESKLPTDTPEMREVHLANLASRKAHLARLQR